MSCIGWDLESTATSLLQGCENRDYSIPVTQKLMTALFTVKLTPKTSTFMDESLGTNLYLWHVFTLA